MFKYLIGKNSLRQDSIVIRACSMCSHDFTKESILGEPHEQKLARVYFHYHDTHGLTTRNNVLNEKVTEAILTAIERD